MDGSTPPDSQIRGSPVLDVLQDHERVGVVTKSSMVLPWVLFSTRTTTLVVPSGTVIDPSTQPRWRLMISQAVPLVMGGSIDFTPDLLLAAKEPRHWEGAPPSGREGRTSFASRAR